MTENLPATLPNPVSHAQQQHIVNIIRRAAKAEIMPRFRGLSASDIASKSRPDDLVTVADSAAEAMMTRALQIAFPHALVVGEEAVADAPDLLGKIADAPLAFIIDPIDGTWNFAHNLAVFGVILAVTQFGRPVFGVIYDPVADDWAISSNEGPPLLERAGGTSKPLRASMGKPLEALNGYIPLGLFKGEAKTKLATTLPTFAHTHPLRCSAHQYRMIAQGYVDFSITESLHPWDHAAGALICERAGAHVEMLDGGPYTAARQSGYLLVAPDRTTWNRLKKVFDFLLEYPSE
ncbi:Inositol monophosphatase [Sulfitobacter noctilucicola]|uniref:Fructose-1,6-bisphosphatase/inositol monophosphatase family enzyme n=1 Tax=Sulfitobacter noctilucicola TaxID=1342301 RepID=A0A7W6M9Y9_9RHOB|nr:inositol monophosphatase [Sulfitobacter noctilucicola]KIN63299.1 Inositol monophosphatase [Sulfitobacter noctilucicola]MBB4175183.1 fructose-1,6-bisphosphatase/inositol monophosphatase family enzyme [Sulfitobacter noctilucicola]